MRQRPSYTLSATLIGALGVAVVGPGPASAQPAEPTEDTFAPEPALPPLPPPNTDFRKDQKLFEEVETEPEALAGTTGGRLERDLLRYERLPALGYTTQAIAGVLAAGVVGLAGASLGAAIDEGDELQPLGGFHGPVFGGFAGSAIGSTLGVWAGGLLFEKETHPGWIGLGSAAGTLVGSGAALGIAAIGGNDAATATFAVTTTLLFQIGGAIMFGDMFLPPPESRTRRDNRGLIDLPDDL